MRKGIWHSDMSRNHCGNKFFFKYFSPRLIKLPIFCYNIKMLLQEINAVIKKHGLKQKDICEALGISQSYASELLNGKKEFDLSLFEKLCNFLKIEIRLIEK